MATNTFDAPIEIAVPKPLVRTASPAFSHIRIPELDGIRALAIWMVLVNHLFNGYPNPEGALAHIPNVVLGVISHGWLGVDLFFILSGFLITGILLDSKTRPAYFRNFYSRRALRILPLYFTVIALMWLCYTGAARFFLISLAFLANFSHYLNAGVPHGAGVFWSLSVEEHFYLLWPLLVLYLSRRNLTILSLLIVVATPVLRGVCAARGMDLDAEIYLYSWFRFDGLALGALLAVWVRTPYSTARNSFKLAALLLISAVIITLVGFPFGLMQRGTLGAALRYTQSQLPFAAFILSALTLRATRWTALLRSSFARLSGDLSYCIYLIHLAIGDAYEFFTHALNLNVAGTVGALGAVLVRAAVILLVTFALALLSRKYLEAPFLRLKRVFS